LTKRFAKALASAAIAATLVFGVWTFADSPAVVAGGETRTISLYHVHTKESLTITYMQNGRYIPSAMKKVNKLMRDWRRNEVITIDPRTLDLMWELHADLGSKKPVHIVCGYRSPRTNAFLRKIGRKVAGKSQHMRGKAIDFYFPDVATKKIRDSALVRRVGGVGYYRSSGGPTGFLHVDSGNVRHWGPAIGRSEMASIMRKGKGTVGKRMSRKGYNADSVPGVSGEDDDEEKSGGLIGALFGTGKKKSKSAAPEAVVASAPEVEVAPPVEAAYQGDDEELAQWSEDAAAAGKKPVSKAVSYEDVADEDVAVPAPKKLAPIEKDNKGLAFMAQTAAVEALADGSAQAEGAVAKPDVVALANIVKPRMKPKAVMVLAAASGIGEDVTIQPASAGPELQTPVKKPSQVADGLGTVESADTMVEEPEYAETNSADGKTSFAADLRDETSEDAPAIEPVMASIDGGDTSWWNRLFSSAEELQRRNGIAPDQSAELSDVLPTAVALGPDGTGPIGNTRSSLEGKGDLLVVNREGKGSLPPMKLRLSEAMLGIDDSSN
jgi:uncharacterized protein YcbK (DUF882 family)